MKNSSRFDEKIEQKFTRSSSRRLGSEATSRTRASKSSQESSRLRNRRPVSPAVSVRIRWRSSRPEGRAWVKNWGRSCYIHRHHPLTSRTPDGTPSHAPRAGQCTGDAVRNRDAPCRRDEYPARGGADRRAGGLAPRPRRRRSAPRAGRRGACQAGRAGVARRDRGRAPGALVPRGAGSQSPQSAGRPALGARQAAHGAGTPANRPPSPGDGARRPRRQAGAPAAARAQAPVRQLGPGRRPLPQSR